MPLKSLFKKNLLLIALIFFVYSWYFATHVAKPPTNYKVLGADSNITLFIEPQAGRDQILGAIQNAQKEILVEVYLLSDKQIISALEDAKARGVNVDVMLEKHPFGGGNLNNQTETELTSHNISFEWTNSAFALTHEKAIIIDSLEVFVLNQNLTTSSFTKNREYDILDTNPNDVMVARNVFINDWKRQNYSPQNLTNLIISPLNSRSALTALISSGATSEDIEIEDIVDDQITSILTAKAKNITIRIIVPTLSQISSNKKDLEILAQNNIKIKTLSSPYIHAKLIVVDNLKAYIGSVNLSTQSMDKNRELGIIISNPEVIQTLQSSFQADWEKAKDFN